MNWKDIVGRTTKLISDNSPIILTSLGVVGTVTTAYLTGKATFKYMKDLGEEGYYDRDYKFAVSPREHIERAWKFYIPAAGSAVVTIAFIIASNRVAGGRAAALAAGYAISERAFAEYRDKVVQRIGNRKELSYRDEIAQERVNRNPPPEDLILLEDGLSVLCCDMFTGRYFLCDMETLRKAENDINFEVNNNYYASLTDFYEAIGIPKTSMSDDFGWNSDKLLELSFSTALTPSGKPCLTFDFKVMPIRGFSRLQ